MSVLKRIAAFPALHPHVQLPSCLAQVVFLRLKKHEGTACRITGMKRICGGKETRNQFLGPSFASETSCSFFSQLDVCDGKVENTQREKHSRKKKI